MDLVKVFESENIDYVLVSESLLDDYLKMINDTEKVGRFIGKLEATSKQEETEWIHRKLEDKDFMFSMVEKKSGEFIGSIGIENIENERGELGIAITAVKQDKGYGKEAIKAMCDHAKIELDLKIIYLKVFPFNDKARHVYEECGFREYDRNDNDIFMELELKDE